MMLLYAHTFPDIVTGLERLLIDWERFLDSETWENLKRNTAALTQNTQNKILVTNVMNPKNAFLISNQSQFNLTQAIAIAIGI